MRKKDIVKQGTYKDIPYRICLLKTGISEWFTAYIQIDLGWMDEEEYDGFPVHGGFTYADEQGWYGWDYAHAGDQIYVDDRFSHLDDMYPHNHRWTLGEVYNEVTQAIERLEGLDVSKI